MEIGQHKSSFSFKNELILCVHSSVSVCMFQLMIQQEGPPQMCVLNLGLLACSIVNCCLLFLVALHIGIMKQKSNFKKKRFDLGYSMRRTFSGGRKDIVLAVRVTQQENGNIGEQKHADNCKQTFTSLWVFSSTLSPPFPTFSTPQHQIGEKKGIEWKVDGINFGLL